MRTTEREQERMKMKHTPKNITENQTKSWTFQEHEGKPTTATINHQRKSENIAIETKYKSQMKMISNENEN